MPSIFDLYSPPKKPNTSTVSGSRSRRLPEHTERAISYGAALLLTLGAPAFWEWVAMNKAAFFAQHIKEED
jgi:hypothetical protein